MRIRGPSEGQHVQSGNFSCLMAPAGPWELVFLFWRRDLFFARKREFFFCVFSPLVFLVVFLRFLVVISHFLGVISRFLGGVFVLRCYYFARSAIFFWLPPPAGP